MKVIITAEQKQYIGKYIENLDQLINNKECSDFLAIFKEFVDEFAEKNEKLTSKY